VIFFILHSWFLVTLFKLFYLDVEITIRNKVMFGLYFSPDHLRQYKYILE